MDSQRNGFDSICFALSIVTIVLLVLASVIEDELLRMITVAIAGGALIYAISRILSTNVAKRRYEADRFSSFFRKDPYRRFKCPKCRTICRVPKGKGKIRIKCPNCGEQFVKRT